MTKNVDITPSLTAVINQKTSSLQAVSDTSKFANALASSSLYNLPDPISLNHSQLLQDLAKMAIPTLSTSKSITKNIDLISPSTTIAKSSMYYKIPPVIKKIMEDSAVNIVSSSMNDAVKKLSKELKSSFESPLVNLLNSFDFSPFKDFLKTLNDDFEETQKLYSQTLYDCNWFPYYTWIVDLSFFEEINHIILSSKGPSSDRINKIDNVVLSYYTPEVIEETKEYWKGAPLKGYIRKMLCQAIDAHLRGEYILTITCLATMWEGLLREKFPSQLTSTKILKGQLFKNEVKKLVIDNGFEEILGDFYNNVILHQCHSVKDVKEGVPNRHGIAHSWYTKYPNKKSSLNAILLTDFIIGLKPKDELKDKKE